MTGASPKSCPRARLPLVLALATFVGGCAFGGSTASGRPNTGAGTGNAGSSSGSGGESTGNSGVGTGSAGTNGCGSAGAGGGTAGDTPLITGTAGSSSGMGSGGAGGGFPSTGSAGTTGSGGGGNPTDGGVTDGGGACVITINPPPVNIQPEAGPTATLTLQASVIGYAGGPDGGPPSWRWQVTMAEGGSLASVNWTPADPSGGSIQVSIATAGTYQVQASIADAPACQGAPSIYVVNPPPTPTYRFRVTPPSSSQAPVREIVVPTPFTGTQEIALDDVMSSVVSLSPVDVNGFAVPAYLRITSPSFTFDLEGDTQRGPVIAPLATTLNYEVLIIPENTGLAPLLVSGLPGALATQMAVTPGTTVTGIARDGSGNPIPGARVILTAGDRPSTVGVSGADGTFSLLARAGALAADIVPPATSGLPNAHIPASPGVTLEGTASLDLAMDYAKLSSGALTVSVKSPGTGASPVAGAQVRVDLATPMASVGALTVHGPTGAVLAATGSAHAAAVTDAQGLASLGLLPAGTYHVIVAPPDGMAGVALTLADVVLTSSGTSANVVLAAPAMLSGTLTPAAAAGAKITAIDHGLLATTTLPTATAAADGTYSLALAVGRTYELLVEPKPGLGLARSVVAVVTPTAGAPARVDVVPTALPWTGKVTNAGLAVPGALVEAFCAVPASSCFDSTLAVAQATTAFDGSLTLALPAAPSGP